MTKSLLIEKLAEKHLISKMRAEVIVNLIFDSISESLVQDDRVEIRGFGSFVNRQYKARQGRNPKTGESITVQAKKLPFFKTGKELRQDLNEKG